MERISGVGCKNFVEPSELGDHIGKVVQMKGMIHKIRKMSGFAFLILRTIRELIQCVTSEESNPMQGNDLCEGAAVIVTGLVVADNRVENGCEIHIRQMEVLSSPVENFPLVINKKKLDVSMDTNLSMRPLALRNPVERAIFKVQEGIARGFREFLTTQQFTEIHTPKIVNAGAEGGANVFGLDYFGKQVFLAQSPQFYKQMMVGVYERVFEIGPVFRAEKHNTSRHLNEYVSMDLEMGFIQNFEEIMGMETCALQYIFQLLGEEYKSELDILGACLPLIDSIPELKFVEAKALISKTYQRPIHDFEDFEPEEERLLGQYMREVYQSDFLFVTHYPSRKRPFYAMDDPADSEFTLSFDLLYKGLEVTTGGQRIHDYHAQVAKMIARGMNPAEFESYLQIHKYGMPPHGGLGAGLERLTMKMLDLDNVRYASLFPRDIERVTP